MVMHTISLLPLLLLLALSAAADDVDLGGEPDAAVVAALQEAQDRADEERQKALDTRDAAFSKLDGHFWPRTLLSAFHTSHLVSAEDHEILKYLRHLAVREVPNSAPASSESPDINGYGGYGGTQNEYTVELTFDDDTPYFTDKVLWRRVRPN